MHHFWKIVQTSVRKGNRDKMIEVEFIENEDKLKGRVEKTVRKAAKAVVVKDGKYLFMRTNKGDYKFAGGGLEAGESYLDALKREVLEETGYRVREIGDALVHVIEKRVDIYDDNAIFTIEQNYYPCELDYSVCFDVDLTDSEKSLDIKVAFVTLEEALEANLKVLADNKPDMNAWVKREVVIMKKLIERS